MIIVIADDLTGAAELAGIGLQYSLNVEMSTIVDQNSNADLLVIATDTRSMKEADAMEEIKKITRKILLFNSELIYKKIDSVLRGHIISEIKVQLKILGKKKALVIAANPSLQRTISNGTYFYNDKPIHQSSFSNDPEFAITSSDVLQMVRAANENVQVKKVNDDISKNVISIGEVSNAEDVKLWAQKIDESILPAGGSDFFSAILDSLKIKRDKKEQSKISSSKQVALFVCGTTFNRSRQLIKEIKQRNGPVSYMPVEIINAEEFDHGAYGLWADEIISFIHLNGKAIISIDPETVTATNVSAKALRKKTALAVKKIFEKIKIGEILIEGGSTAASVIRELNIKSFIPIEELAQGVVRMKVKDNKNLFITVKPGSYDWPDKVWNF